MKIDKIFLKIEKSLSKISKVKIRYIEKVEIFYFIPLVSIIIGTFIALSKGSYNLVFGIVPKDYYVNNVIAISLLIGILPLAIIGIINHRYIRKLDKSIPKFFDSLIDNIKGGLSFVLALERASSLHREPLGEVVQEAIKKFLAGMDFEEAMRIASKKLKHPKGGEFIQILKRAFLAGEAGVEGIKTASRYYYLLEDYRINKENDLKPYLFIIFLSIIIYIFVSGILLTQFFVPISQLQQPSIPAQQPIQETQFYRFDAMYFWSIFFWLGIIESLIGGIIVGKLIYNSSLRGLIYSIILLLINILCFNFLFKV